MKKQMSTQKSTHHFQDFHTGILSKVCIFVGILIIVSYFIIWGAFSYAIHGESFLDYRELAGWSSLSIIFIVIGFILYFIHLQLLKLHKITEELHSTYLDVNPKER
jgi:hypothetical protein